MHKVICKKCGWKGVEQDLITDDADKDDDIHCPKCGSDDIDIEISEDLDFLEDDADELDPGIFDEDGLY